MVEPSAATGQAAAPRLSVIVITKDAAAGIEACLTSVAFADEIVVVDSGSRDDTVARALRHGARVIQTPDWPGFGPQKQRALSAARGDWVLTLDADEWLDERLQAAVQAVVAAPIAPDTPAGFRSARLSAFGRRWMAHGGWYPDPGIRLVQRLRARFSDDLVHERLIVDGPLGALPGLLLHDSIPTLADSIDKMNRYSSGRAQDLAARGKPGGLGRALAHGVWAFVRTWVLRRGFLDGQMGFILAVHNAETTYYRYLKLGLEAQGPASLSPPPALPGLPADGVPPAGG